MPVFMVRWELEGYMPIEAGSKEEADELARDYIDDDVRNMSLANDAFIGHAKEIKSVKDAVNLDHTFDGGDYQVYNSAKPLKELVPLE